MLIEEKKTKNNLFILPLVEKPLTDSWCLEYSWINNKKR